MIVRIFESVDPYDYDRTHNLIVDKFCKGIQIYSLSECPEDAIVGRSLIDGNDIASFMQLAADAVKNGESFEVRNYDLGEIDVNSDDYYNAIEKIITEED